MCGWFDYNIEVMQESRKYSYTFYHLYEPVSNYSSPGESKYCPKTTPFKPAQINTVYSHLVPESPY